MFDRVGRFNFQAGIVMHFFAAVLAAFRQCRAVFSRHKGAHLLRCVDQLDVEYQVRLAYERFLAHLAPVQMLLFTYNGYDGA